VSNKTETLEDKELVEKVLSGNANAFSFIIKSTEGLVAQIVFKMISNSEDRKDMAQDIYLKAFKNLSNFRFGSKLSTWIGQIAYNNCTDFLRKKKLVLIDNMHGDEEPQEQELEHLHQKFSASESFNAESIIFQRELSGILKREIEKLSPVFKTLITLYHNEELTYEEISQITGLPVGTIKSYLFRARKALRDNVLLNYKKEEL
jgi:RNA polymerase sigma factor (sigma-70 family)